MHLIVLETEPTNTRGGQELNLFEICRGLSERGHQISLIYNRPGNLLERYQEFCANTLQIKRYGFNRHKVNEFLEFLSPLAATLKIPTSEETIVFSNAYCSSFYGGLIAKFKQVPFVCYLQIPPFDVNLQRRLGLQSVDRFIAVSQQTKNDWRDAIRDANEKIAVVHNGTNLDQFSPTSDLAQLRSRWNLDLKTPVLAYVGRLDKEKGLEILIEALSLLKTQGLPAKLFIAGKPLVHFNPELGRECPEMGERYKQSLQDLAETLGVGDSVTFLGHLSNPMQLFQLADVSVVPSLWSEAFGRVVIESLACGTPVVASRVGGIPEILTGEFATGLAEPGNAADLAAKLIEKIHWRDRDPQLGQRCRDHVLTHFSIEQMVSGIESVLLKTLPQPVESLC